MDSLFFRVTNIAFNEKGMKVMKKLLLKWYKFQYKRILKLKQKEIQKAAKYCLEDEMFMSYDCLQRSKYYSNKLIKITKRMEDLA